MPVSILVAALITEAASSVLVHWLVFFRKLSKGHEHMSFPKLGPSKRIDDFGCGPNSHGSTPSPRKSSIFLSNSKVLGKVDAFPEDLVLRILLENRFRLKENVLVWVRDIRIPK